MMIKKIQVKRMLVIALIAFAIIASSVTDVQAGRALRKGVRGAAAGALVGARTDAITGAIDTGTAATGTGDADRPK